MIRFLKNTYHSNFLFIKDAAEILKRVGESYFDKNLQQTACALGSSDKPGGIFFGSR